VTANLPPSQPALGTHIPGDGHGRPPASTPDNGTPTAAEPSPAPDTFEREGLGGPSPAAVGGAGRAAAARAKAPRPSVWEQAWRYLRDPRRRTYVVLGAIATIGLVAFGVYAIVAGPPPTVEGVVVFTADTTPAQKEAVRTACPSVGGAIQEPPDHNNLDLTRVYPLRYNLTKASSSDRAKLFECVQGRPGVIGISTETQGQ
jgi:hypothetical protein